MLTACSIGERTRDEGGHSLVVLNDASVMVRQRETLPNMGTWAYGNSRLHPLWP